MQTIAAAVDIATPAVYHHGREQAQGPSRDPRRFVDLLIGPQQARAGIGLRPDQMLLEVMADVLELMETNRGYVRVFFEHHRELTGGRAGRRQGKARPLPAMVEDVIRAGIAAGDFRETDSTVAVLAFFGMCNWAAWRSGRAAHDLRPQANWWGRAQCEHPVDVQRRPVLQVVEDFGV